MTLNQMGWITDDSSGGSLCWEESNNFVDLQRSLRLYPHGQGKVESPMLQQKKRNDKLPYRSLLQDRVPPTRKEGGRKTDLWQFPQDSYLAIFLGESQNVLPRFWPDFVWAVSKWSMWKRARSPGPYGGVIPLYIHYIN